MRAIQIVEPRKIAMLEDDALKAPAFAVIGSGAVADEAWSGALAAEIAGMNPPMTSISRRAPRIFAISATAY